MKIGILGGGQLGRMMALAGYPLGLTFRFLEPALESSAAQVGERVRGEFEDYRVLYDFAQGLDAVTYEFENVPVDTARWLAERLPLWPPPEALAAAQDRIVEKTFFASLGIPVPSFAAIENRTDFDNALERIGFPAVLKTTRFGYDGKGQTVLCDRNAAAGAWERLSGRPLILERFVPFQRELSIVSVRGRDGATAFYPLVENVHRDGMLRRTTAPAPRLTGELQSKAEAYAVRTLQALNYVGVLAIELFEIDGELMVNEMAPRVHNSGHWTIEGAETSQFENHVRAVAGLPLGSTKPLGASVMLNLIGSRPPIEEVLKVPGAHLHLYGKTPRVGRKLGHITLCDQDAHDVTERIDQLAAMMPNSI